MSVVGDFLYCKDQQFGIVAAVYLNDVAEEQTYPLAIKGDG